MGGLVQVKSEHIRREQQDHFLFYAAILNYTNNNYICNPAIH
jgi:hypothetical protein